MNGAVPRACTPLIAPANFSMRSRSEKNLAENDGERIGIRLSAGLPMPSMFMAAGAMKSITHLDPFSFRPPKE